MQKEKNGSLLYKDVFKSPFDGFCTDAEASSTPAAAAAVSSPPIRPWLPRRELTLSVGTLVFSTLLTRNKPLGA